MLNGRPIPPFPPIRGSSGVERLPEEQRGAGSIPALGTVVGWSKGRTSGFDPGGVGSTPTPAAIRKVSGWSRKLSRKQLALTGSGVRFPHLPPQGISLVVRRRVLAPQTEVRFLDPLPRGRRLVVGYLPFTQETSVQIRLAVPLSVRLNRQSPDETG